MRLRSGRVGVLTVRGVATAVAVAGLVMAIEVRADEELLTDRPDFTETSVVVAPRSFQLEGGLTFESAVDVETLSGAELLLRAGLMKRLELRLGAPDLVHTRVSGASDTGLGEAYVGLKLQLGTSGAPNGLALIPAVTFPTDPDASGGTAPELVLTWAHDLPNEWAVGGIVGYAWLEQADRGPDVSFPTVSFARGFAERWGTFFEWAAEFPDGGDASHLAHHGYTYGLGANGQLDVHLGIGLTDTAPDFFLGIGFALRR
ncbi:MAG TPA: transporter [Candidatus Limnocylindria bacterium]|nr:transporter [Candidatus Limnocylindria bacterium]